MKKTVLLVFISVLLLSLVHWARFTSSSASMDQIADLSFDSMSLTIDWGHYHNYTEIVDILLSLNATYPNIVDVFSIGRSWQNRSIYCVRLTNESATYSKPKTMFVGYHHARERITAELPLYFVVYAAENYGVNATVTQMLDLSEIYVVVALNVDAFDVVDANEWQRKNARPINEDGDDLFDEDPPDDEDNDGFIERLHPTSPNGIEWEGVDDDGDGLFNEDWVGGVDLNRNYGYEWNASVESGSPDPQDQVYRGPSPFSEPETRAIRDLALQHDFEYAISFHSGADVILYPWGHATNPTPDDQKFREIASDMSALVGSSYEQSESMYTTSGGWGDWMYGNRSVFALTCEIYENNSAWQWEHGPDYWREKGVFQYFNPDPNLIESTLLRWMPIFTYVSNRAIHEYIIVPEEYATIQAAISAASSGATIFVRAGTYYENVVVNKTVSLVGEDKETTIIDGNMSGTVVDVTASGVLITNFTIRNSGNKTLNSGIRVWTSHCNITNNLIINNQYGVLLFDSSNSTISGNVMNGNKYSFGVEGSRLSDFMHSIDVSNLVDGKLVYYLLNQKDLVINSSTYPDVGYLALVNCSHIVVEGLTLTNNDQGLLLAYTNDSRVTNNNLTNNWHGTNLFGSSNNAISGNNIANNEWGVNFSSSSNNRFYHNNFINNTHQVDSIASVNVWDDGYPSGGNYWSDYTGQDSDGDGIGDTPYIIDANNQDKYPLMHPWGIIVEEAAPFWTQWWFLTIVIAGIVVLAVAVYFLKKRKPPTPTAPPLPTEDTTEYLFCLQLP